MFKIGDRLQFIDEKDTKIIVCYSDTILSKYIYYKCIIFKGNFLKEETSEINIAHISQLEYDYDYYRKMKLEKIVKCLR